jgi:alkaline phosphatase
LLSGSQGGVLLGGRDDGRARNVILFIGDAGGIPTLNAASIYGHEQAQGLFIQQMPHVALMDTSASDRWVTDSAAGMSAIVTGQKTKNGVISQSADAVRGKADGAVLQTILEHAEQRGLSTGMITNMNIADATPAACYAHSNDRSKLGEIFAQLARPRFGDGPDVIVGAGRTTVLTRTKALGIDMEATLRQQGYTLLDTPAAITPASTRVVSVVDDAEFDPLPVLDSAIRILSRNRRGYFLMVEWDMHTTRLERGLKRVLTMDSMVRRAAKEAKNTLVIFTADHSFDLRVRAGNKGEPLLPPAPSAVPTPVNGHSAAPVDEEAKARKLAEEKAAAEKANVRVFDGHTGEQVLVAAQGPGSARVRGFIQNTDVFRIMMAAFGWDSERSATH